MEVCKSYFPFKILFDIFNHQAITPILIEHCNCISPAIALLHQGSWPTTPIKASTWAFDIKLLEFARLLSLYGSPNISALSNAIGAFLMWSGVPNVPVSVSCNASSHNNFDQIFSYYQMLYKHLHTALQYYQLALDAVNNLIWNVSHLPAASLPQTSTDAVSALSSEVNEDPPPLVTAHQAATFSTSQETSKHDSKSNQPPPALTTSYIETQCHNSSMTSFIGPLESPMSQGDSPSWHLQRRCPICFPGHRPTAFDR